MKKLAIFACVMVVSAGAAVAATASIPFFSDTAFSSWITVQNISTDDVTITVAYHSLGSDSSPSTSVLAPKASLSWRPFDSTPGNGEVQGDLDDSPYEFGSAQIDSSGPIAGRFVQIINGDAYAFGHNVEIN